MAVSVKLLNSKFRCIIGDGVKETVSATGSTTSAGGKGGNRILSSTTSESREQSASPTTGDDLNVEEIKHLYTSGIFDPDAPDTLQNKVVFEVCLHLYVPLNQSINQSINLGSV